MRVYDKQEFMKNHPPNTNACMFIESINNKDEVVVFGKHINIERKLFEKCEDYYECKSV